MSKAAYLQEVGLILADLKANYAEYQKAKAKQDALINRWKEVNRREWAKRDDSGLGFIPTGGGDGNVRNYYMAPDGPARVQFSRIP